MATAWSRKSQGQVASWDALRPAGPEGGVERYSSGPSAYNPPPRGGAPHAPRPASASLSMHDPQQAATPPATSTATHTAAATPAPAAALAAGAAAGVGASDAAPSNPYAGVGAPAASHGHGHGHGHGHSHGGGGHTHGAAGILGGERDLFVACGAGNVEAVKRLVAMGGDVSSFDAKGATPLHWAALNNQTDVVRYLLSEGADPDAPNSVSLQTPLHWASIHGYIETIRILLDEGQAQPDKSDAQGFNALHHAVQYGQTLCAHFLLERGLAVDARDDARHTPLLWAAYRGHEETAQYLLSRGADIRAQDDTGCSALHWAALKNHIGVAKLLVKGGAPLDLRDDSNCTPEACAVEKNHKTMAQYLNFVRVAGSTESGDALLESSTKLNKALIFVAFGSILPGLSMLLEWGSLFFGLAVFVPLFGAGVYMLKPRWSLANQDYAYLGMLVTSALQAYYLWASVVMPLSPPSILTAILVLVLSLIAVVTYYRLLTSDPGFTPVASDFDSMLEEAAGGSEASTMFCRHCKTRKPLRSEHCLKCARCVAKYSHHCPWAANCVGHKNQAVALVCLISVTCLLYIFQLSVLGSLTASPHSPSLWNIFGFATHMYMTSPALFIIFLWALANTVWTTRLSFSSINYLRTGLTIHESLTRKPYLFSPGGRYANPFDAGPAHNVKRFFGLEPEPHDWLTLYHVPGRPTTRESERSSGSMVA